MREYKNWITPTILDDEDVEYLIEKSRRTGEDTKTLDIKTEEWLQQVRKRVRTLNAAFNAIQNSK